jgi:hypothetical protein
MKKPSNLFDIGVLFMALGAATALKAQPVPSYSTQSIPVPLVIPAATTTNLVTPLLIDTKKLQNVALMMGTTWSTAGEATGNTNLIYTLAPTVDGVNMDTNRTITITAYNNTVAGTVSYTRTNLQANGLSGWYIIKVVNNSAAGVATNQPSSGMVQSIKIGAP